MRDDPLCSRLCGERGTMVHTLAGCKTALSQGRYRWHHGKVLCELTDILKWERQKKCQTSARRQHSFSSSEKGRNHHPPKGRKEPLASSTILGVEGGPGKETSLPCCANITETGHGPMSEEVRKINFPWEGR